MNDYLRISIFFGTGAPEHVSPHGASRWYEEEEQQQKQEEEVGEGRKVTGDRDCWRGPSKGMYLFGFSLPSELYITSDTWHMRTYLNCVHIYMHIYTRYVERKGAYKGGGVCPCRGAGCRGRGQGVRVHGPRALPTNTHASTSPHHSTTAATTRSPAPTITRQHMRCPLQRSRSCAFSLGGSVL